MKAIVRAGLLMILVHVTIVSGNIDIQNADSIWNSTITPASEDVTNLSEAPPQHISSIFIGDADTVWNSTITPASEDVTNSDEALPQHISSIFIGDADMVWNSSITPASEDVTNSNESLPQYISSIFIGDAETVWNQELSEPVDLIPLTELIMNETSSTNQTLFETVISQTSTLNTSITGDLTGSLNFTGLEIILINSGSFAGKGFSKGNWSANIEGIPYEGHWQGMLFKKPDERTFYIKGTVSGGLKGVVEGNLVESVNGSDIYDKYQAVWMINQMDVYPVFAKVDVNGIVNYQNHAEYLSELYALQTYIVGKASGHYNVSLNFILTHVRIDTATNPYYGQGFSIFSYVSESGSGEGWTYDKKISPGVVELKGPFTDPLRGIASGFLDVSGGSRKLSISVERIDVGSPPVAYPIVRVSGPERVSPGQTVDYIIEYGNVGLKEADNYDIIMELPSSTKYISSTHGGIYNEYTHTITWHKEKIHAHFLEQIVSKVTLNWDLAQNTRIDCLVYVVKQEQSYFDPTIITTLIESNVTTDSINSTFRVSNITTSELFFINITRTEVLQPITSIFNYSVNPDGERILELIFTAQNTTRTSYSMNSKTHSTAQIDIPWDRIRVRFREGQQVYNLISWERELAIAEQVRIRENNWLRYLRDNNFIGDGTYEEQLNLNEARPLWEWGSHLIGYIPPLRLMPLGPQIIGLLDRIMREFIYTGKDNIMAHEVWTNIGVKYAERTMPNGVPDTVTDYFQLKKWFISTQTNSASSSSGFINTARDPNIKYGPSGFIQPYQKLNYTVEFENEGEGIAFGVYFTDTLDQDLNDSTLEIGPLINVKNGSVMAPPGVYDPGTRTITWFIGEVGSKEGGYSNISIKPRSDPEEGTEIINYATVYFPSVPETTKTNGIVSIIDVTPPRYFNVSQSKSNATVGNFVKVSAFWKDGVQLNHTWLETNEGGTWQNVSQLNLSLTEMWSNFSIQTKNEGTICWRIYANDTAGNENVTPVLCFDVILDITPPQSITNLSLQNGTTWLNFTWLNPHDPDFSHVMLYLNGAFLTSILAPQNYYNFIGLLPDTSYELGTRTVDASGNNNLTWVNHTAKTLLVTPTPIPTATAIPTPSPTSTVTATTTPTPTPTTGRDVVSRYAGIDGIVQKSEAVQAVMDYFSSMITRQEAISVVMAYFNG